MTSHEHMPKILIPSYLKCHLCEKSFQSEISLRTHLLTHLNSSGQPGTLVCEINVPAGINVPPGKFSKNDKRAPWKT